MQEVPANFGEQTNHSYFSYFDNGGEMGELIKHCDWLKSSLGSPEHWPQSLLVTLGIILHSKFPMFLFWGEEHICFYNNAYRPSLGNNGKHPFALGKKASDVWPEIWPDIKPLIDQVLAGGGATWSEDQLLPIYRNGQMEDVYWTFSYSPVMGESGKPEGVFVTVVETTEKVLSSMKLKESEQRFRRLIKNATVGVIVLRGTDMVVDIVNEMYCNLIHKDYEEVVGKRIFDVIPEMQEYFKDIINQVRNTGEPLYLYDYPYFILDNGLKRNGFLDLVYQPYKEDDGKITGVIVLANNVTEQVTSRKKIEEAEEKARLAINSAGLGVYEIVYNSNEMITDSRFDEIWGFDRRMLRNDYAGVIHTDDLAARDVAHRTSLQTGLLEYEARIFWKDRSIRWIRVKGKVLFDEKGSALKLIGVVQDVTDMVIAQKKIEESERNIRNMILQAPVAMCILKGPLYIVEIANNNMFELWGKQEAEVMNKPMFEGLPEAKEQGLEQMLSQVFATGERFTANERQINLPRNNGVGQAYVNFTCVALKEGDGSIWGILAVAIDVTAQVLARQKIEAAEERARFAINSAALGLFEADLVTNNVVTDARYKEIFGLDKVENWHEIKNYLHPEDLHIREKAHENALQTGTLQYDARIFKKDSSIYWIRAMGKVIYNDKGEPIKVSGVIQDITEQKEFAEALEKKVQERTKELAEANLQLQQSNIELNQFAYIASHDLQEPLRKVRTFTELMQLSLQDVPDQAKNYINRIQSSIERMQTLISDVLKFSLLSKEREKFEDVDLNLVLKNIIDDYELLIEQKGAKIIKGTLPVIEAIPLQMSQLFTNLISNALKFSSTERRLEVFIQSRQLTKEEIRKHKELNEDKVHFEIDFKDNGIGFNQENAQQIFIIFQRLHGKMDYAGTGIGLAMCKKITANHYGAIYASSHLNEGATFTVVLPQVQS